MPEWLSGIDLVGRQYQFQNINWSVIYDDLRHAFVGIICRKRFVVVPIPNTYFWVMVTETNELTIVNGKSFSGWECIRKFDLTTVYPAF